MREGGSEGGRKGGRGGGREGRSAWVHKGVSEQVRE